MWHKDNSALNFERELLNGDLYSENMVNETFNRLPRHDFDDYTHYSEFCGSIFNDVICCVNSSKNSFDVCCCSW